MTRAASRDEFNMLYHLHIKKKKVSLRFSQKHNSSKHTILNTRKEKLNQSSSKSSESSSSSSESELALSNNSSSLCNGSASPPGKGASGVLTRRYTPHKQAVIVLDTSQNDILKQIRIQPFRQHLRSQSNNWHSLNTQEVNINKVGAITLRSRELKFADHGGKG